MNGSGKVLPSLGRWSWERASAFDGDGDCTPPPPMGKDPGAAPDSRCPRMDPEFTNLIFKQRVQEPVGLSLLPHLFFLAKTKRQADGPSTAAEPVAHAFLLMLFLGFPVHNEGPGGVAHGVVLSRHHTEARTGQTLAAAAAATPTGGHGARVLSCSAHTNTARETQNRMDCPPAMCPSK